MKKFTNNSRKGFTNIEVSLVLAIAGLIFLMIFVALPALQRGQRDAQRRDDIMTYLEQLKKYQTNNRGNLPSDESWKAKFTDVYFKGHSDPSSGDAYGQEIVSCEKQGSSVKTGNACDHGSVKNIYESDFPYGNYTILVVRQATCGEDSGGNVYPVKTSNPRSVAALYRLEVGGVYCDNI